jgi:hypothetical protein
MKCVDNDLYDSAPAGYDLLVAPHLHAAVLDSDDLVLIKLCPDPVPIGYVALVCSSDGINTHFLP